jgi:hypothetical protein
MHPLHGTNDAAIQAAAIEYRCCDHPSFDVMFAGSIANPFIIGEAAIVLPPLLVAQLELIETAEADGRRAVEVLRRQWAEVERLIGRPMHEKIAEFFGVPWQQGRLMIARFVDEVLGEPPGEGVPASLNSAARTKSRANPDPEIKAWFDRARAHPVEDLLERRKFKQTGGTRNERKYPCPACGGDDRFGLNISKQMFICHQCGIKGKGALDFLVRIGEAEAPWQAAEVLEGPPPRQPEPNNKPKPKPDWNHPQGEFIYHDADGKVVFKKIRYPLINEDGSPALDSRGKPKKSFCSMCRMRLIGQAGGNQTTATPSIWFPTGFTICSPHSLPTALSERSLLRVRLRRIC